MSAPSELTARCTVVVAAAGYGKTEAVRRWLRSARPRWHKGSIPAPLDPGWHVVDDLTGPSGSEIDALLDRLTHQPSTNVVLVSRAPLPRPSGPTDASLIDERGPIDLALTTAEIAEVLHERLGPRADHLAATVHDLTAGWPSLVHLVAEQLARLDGITDADLATGTIGAAAIAGPGSALAAFVAKHVLEPLPRPAARLVPTIAQLGAIDENRYVALGYRRATPSIDHLTRIGLIDITGEKDRRLVPVLGQVAIDRWPLAQPERADLFARAGAWYAEHGQPRAAIEAYRVAGDSRSCARLLRDHGPSWVHAGGAATIIEAVASLSPADRTPPIRLLHGEALLVVGDDERALAELTALAELVASSDGDVPTAAAGPLSPAPTGHLPAGLAGRLPASLAWRLAAAYCQRADPDTASMMVGLVRPDETSVADHALVLAWTATARWLAGDLVGSGDFARRALQTAERANDDRARGAAHVALAMHAMLTGDRSGTMAHYDQALRYARAAHDVVQEVRIHNNQAARLLEEALYPQALDQARQATALATASGCGAMLPAAVCNEAESLFRLGRLDEAMACYTRALNLFQARRSGKLAYPLIGIGAIHRIQGRLSLARAAYEEAYRASTATGNVQALIPALAGLARVLAGTDPSEAVRFAALAREAASGPHVAEAALATGWAWLGAGDRSAAIRSAVEASDEARRHRDSRGLAEALELQAAATDHPAQRRRLLGEAADTWCLAGATLDRDRVVAALGSLPTASVAERIEARLARERLETAGVVLPTMAVLPGSEALKPVVIRTLGRFEVMVGETMVTASMWQSRKARELLGILVARRGRAIAREELSELLWPEGERDRVAHRLSVALSTLRSVLDPDRAGPADRFVVADRSGVALDVTQVAIDLEQFHDEARHGLTLRDRGRGGEARVALAAAERRYAGDFLENEPYEDWSVATREEARATYLRIVRALAELCRQTGLVDDAVHYQLKVLDKDPYDEHVHRELVATLAAAGRHGESRRARARYLAAMRAIGVTGAPPI